LTGYALFTLLFFNLNNQEHLCCPKNKMFHYSYNTSTFSNKEGATDRTAQHMALVAKLHHEFDGELNKGQQHIADITHRCKQCGIYNDFIYIIKENLPPSSMDLSDPKEKAHWDQDLDCFILGNLLDDPSKATLENVQQVRDIVRKMANNLHTKPKAGSIESEHLTSFQNCMWFYDLLLGSWSDNMLSIMSKYLENHDGDGVVLYYCCIKHFAGATKANIIAAYADLTEVKVHLHLYNNDVSAFTNAVRIPTRKLANCQKQPTFQHMMNVYHGVMDCPNTEFSNYVHSLYHEYRAEGPASTWTMLQLLDALDLEYKCLQSLNRWDKQPIKNSKSSPLPLRCPRSRLTFLNCRRLLVLKTQELSRNQLNLPRKVKCRQLQ
jgi:hypothetical protein